MRGNMTLGEYFASHNDDHYGTLHEEIVRCRDCVCFQMKVFDDGEHLHWCFYHGSDYAEPDGFCAWGERKADE